MRNFSACLFDLDGVIVETDKYHYEAWKTLADELKIPFTQDDNEKLKGVSRMASLDIILNLGNVSLDKEEKTRIAEKKNNLYREYLKKLSSNSILPGVENILKLFKQHHVKVGIGSSSKNANLILKQVGLIDAFDVIIDGSMVEKSKPEPDIFLLGAKELLVNPKECLVIEDAQAGLLAAKKANMKCVGIGNALNLSDADLVIENLNHLTLENVKALFNKKRKKESA